MLSFLKKCISHVMLKFTDGKRLLFSVNYTCLCCEEWLSNKQHWKGEVMGEATIFTAEMTA